MEHGGGAGALDELTGLIGRAAFHERLATLCERPDAAVALALVDLDMLRCINETLGRPSADVFLVDLARRLEPIVEGDGFAARIDGDEFALIQPGIDDPTALKVWAAGIAATARAPVKVEGVEFALTASVGAAMLPLDADGAWELIRSADVAQFVAKSTGRDRAVPYKTSLRTQIENRVKECVASGNFGLHYQPILTLAEPRRVVEVECFLRWRHPARGLLFPGDFRPVLEDRAAALLLGGFVIDEAARQIRRWIDQGVAFGRVSVNLSAAQLRLPDFARDVLARLAAKRAPPAQLSVELPEDAYVSGDLALLAAQLERLRGEGVRVVVDGYAGSAATLSELQRLPIDALKLDRSVTQEDRAANRLGLWVKRAADHGVAIVAEGLETAEQLERLVELGCTLAQGYFLARPMAAAKLPDFLKRLAGGEERMVA